MAFSATMPPSWDRRDAPPFSYRPDGAAMNNTGSETPTEAPAANGAEAPAAEAKPPEKTVQEVLGSMHTTNFPDLLRQLKGCLVVSTYQAGKLVILRPDGNSINTHFRSFNRPMGMAADNERLALGAHIEIAEFRNMPAVARRLQDPPKHDAVYLARRGHITGAIDIHEMAFDKFGDLWFVNTLFSCL